MKEALAIASDRLGRKKLVKTSAHLADSRRSMIVARTDHGRTASRSSWTIRSVPRTGEVKNAKTPAVPHSFTRASHEPSAAPCRIFRLRSGDVFVRPFRRI